MLSPFSMEWWQLLPYHITLPFFASREHHGCSEPVCKKPVFRLVWVLGKPRIVPAVVCKASHIPLHAVSHDFNCAEMVEEKLAVEIGVTRIHPRQATWRKILSSPKMARFHLFRLALHPSLLKPNFRTLVKRNFQIIRL